MTKIKILLLNTFISLLVISCGVPQKDHDKLQSQNDSIRVVIDNLQLQIQQISLERDQYFEKWSDGKAELKKANKRNSNYNCNYVSEERAIEIIHSDFEFYKKEIIYQNMELRRQSNCVFDVSMMTKCKEVNRVLDKWSNSLLKLKVTGDKYTLELNEGFLPVCL